MSKGLEELKEIKEACATHMGRLVYILQEDKFEAVEKELKDKEQSDKALEIIKEILDDDLFSKLNSNSRKIIKEIIDKLPKEKLDLLKEVLS